MKGNNNATPSKWAQISSWFSPTSESRATGLVGLSTGERMVVTPGKLSGWGWNFVFILETRTGRADRDMRGKRERKQMFLLFGLKNQWWWFWSWCQTDYVSFVTLLETDFLSLSLSLTIRNLLLSAETVSLKEKIKKLTEVWHHYDTFWEEERDSVF